MLRHGPLALLLTCAACASSPPPMPDPPTKQAPAKPPERPKDLIYRVELEHVLKRGPGWFLSQVPIEEVLEGDKFVGWRLLELPVEWNGIELVPGDVVTGVNGMTLEKPDDFFSAWTTLSVASELKVAYLHEGEPRELTYRIEGSPDPQLAKELREPPKEGERPEAERKKTVIIRGKEGPTNETMVDWSQ